MVIENFLKNALSVTGKKIFFESKNDVDEFFERFKTPKFFSKFKSRYQRIFVSITL